MLSDVCEVVQAIKQVKYNRKSNKMISPTNKVMTAI